MAATSGKDKAPSKQRKPRAKKLAPDPEGLGIDDAAAAAAAAAATSPEPEPSDTPPGPASGGRAPRRRVSKKLTRQIEDGLAEILTMPAVPCAAIGAINSDPGMEWMAEHFATQGRELANKIAVVSERNDVLRRWCERALEGETIAVLAIASLMYVYPPLLYMGWVPGPAGALGVPQRVKRTEQGPAAGTEPETPTHTEPPEPIPYGGVPQEVEEELEPPAAMV